MVAQDFYFVKTRFAQPENPYSVIASDRRERDSLILSFRALRGISGILTEEILRFAQDDISGSQ